MAGLVDGDGCIYVAAVGPHRTRSVYPIVTVAMTHLGVIQWLCRRLKAGTVKFHNQTNMRRFPHYKKQYRFQVFGKRARLLCEVMLPHLRVKRPQAKLVLGFPCDARSGPGVGISAAINRRRFALRDKISALNH